MKRISPAGLLLNLALVASLVGAPFPTTGQTRSKSEHVSSDSSQRDRPALVQMSDVKYLLGATALIGIAYSADRSVERRFLRRDFQDNKALRKTFDDVGILGDPGPIVFSAVVYLGGIAAQSRKATALGMYAGEAVVLGGIVSETMKGVVGRSRPKIDSTRVSDIHLGRGFSNDDYGSFPSAETTIAFAAATASSLYVRRQWPSAAHMVTPVAYTAASLVGISRIYKNEHWMSDVVTGAAVGTLAGVGFDRWNRAHPDNVFERVFLPRSIAPSNGGLAAMWYFDLQ